MLALDVAASPRAARRRSGDFGGSRPGSAAQPPSTPVPPPPVQKRAPFPSRRAFATSTATALLLLAWRWHTRPPARGLPATCTPADAATRLKLFDNLGGFAPLRHAGASHAVHAGLLLAVGYHRSAAVATFTAAAAGDPSDPLPQWGLAYALGPGANKAAAAEDNTPFPAFTPGNWTAARAAAAEAHRLAAAAEDPFTLALTAATANVRYGPGSSPADLAAWAAAEAAFAEEVATKVAGAAPTPAAASLALALAAEAAATPLQWAAVKGGELVPGAAHALDLVHRALEKDAANPLALHLAIHLSEALPPGAAAASSPAAADAARAAGLAAAATLASPGPWATAPIPHLLHMAGHAFARAGRWKEAVAAGKKALAADARLAAVCVESYAVEHNAAALAHAANMGGDVKASAGAGAAAAAAVDEAGPALAYAAGSREATLPLWRGVLFADWGAVRALSPLTPLSRGLCPGGGGRAFAGAVRAWGEAMAVAAGVAGGNLPRAHLATALAALEAAVAAVPPEPVTAPGPPPGLYACGHATIAPRLLRLARARVDWVDGRKPAAVAALAKLAEEEAGDPYMEPPRSPFPARPCAGWAAAEAGDVEGATAHFRADLSERPHHARAWVGLAAVARARGDTAAAEAAVRKAKAAWAGTSLPPSACPAFSEVGGVE